MSALVPLILLTLTFLLMAVPLGLPGDATFAPPMLMLSAMFLCAASPSMRLPAWVAMLFGLAADIVTASPVGFWGLLALLAHGAGSLLTDQEWTQRFGNLWAVWSVAAAAIAFAAWCIASVYFFRAIGWQPVALGAALSVLFFPIVGVIVKLLRTWVPDRHIRPGARLP